MPHNFIDDETLLPSLPWRLLGKDWQTLTTYYWSYNNKRDELLGREWSFVDLLGDGIASRDKLIENAVAAEPPGVPWNYTLEETYAPWLVYPEIGGFNPWEVAFEEMYGGPVEQDEDSWRAGVGVMALVGSHRGKFALGLIIRTLVRGDQVFAAQCLEQLVCLSRRGRPPSP